MNLLSPGGTFYPHACHCLMHIIVVCSTSKKRRRTPTATASEERGSTQKKRSRTQDSHDELLSPHRMRQAGGARSSPLPEETATRTATPAGTTLVRSDTLTSATSLSSSSSKKKKKKKKKKKNKDNAVKRRLAEC